MDNNTQEEEIKRIKSLIIKSILGECEDNESEELKEWASHSKGREELLERFSKKSYLDLARERYRAAKFGAKPKRVRKQINYFLRVAAIFLIPVMVFTSIKYFVKLEKSAQNFMRLSLAVGNNPSKSLLESECTNYLLQRGVLIIGDTLDYSNSKFRSKELHTLYVPKKKNFTLKLPDGSVVKLNSESSLTFASGAEKRGTNKERMVRLLGEGFFEVVKSNVPFRVITEEQEVLVRGTSFNIKAYPNEQNVKTTLVDGVVEVSATFERESLRSTSLKPGEQFILDKRDNHYEVKGVDVSKSIAWREGLYYFESERLEEIMNNISRWYGLVVMFKSDDLKEILLTGRLKRNETPQALIKSIGNIQSVEIIRSDNILIIRKREH